MTNQQRQLLLGASGLLVIFLVLFLYKRSSDTSALKVEPLIKTLPQRFSEKLDENGYVSVKSLFKDCDNHPKEKEAREIWERGWF